MKKQKKSRRHEGPYTSNDLFRRVAASTSHGVGSPWAFIGALGVIVVWGITGPLFHFSDTWQLVINTGTTIVTFLMVFLIQNTQNRDSHAIHLKLDELIRANDLARNNLMCLEDLDDNELEELQDEFSRLAAGKIAERDTKSERTSERRPRASEPAQNDGDSKISSSRTSSSRSSRAT